MQVPFIYFQKMEIHGLNFKLLMHLMAFQEVISARVLPWMERRWLLVRLRLRIQATRLSTISMEDNGFKHLAWSFQMETQQVLVSVKLFAYPVIR